MSFAATVISFGEWLPDQPALGNAGLLVANNVLPLDSGYGPFRPLDSSLATLPGGATAFGMAGNIAVSGITKGASAVYVAADNFYFSVNGGAFQNRGTAGANKASFAQFDNLVIATSEDLVTPLKHTIGSGTNFSTLSASTTLRPAAHVGVIGRFVFVANLKESATATAAQYPSTMQWSAIDQPTNWPVANSATAIATQAGEQILQPNYGEIMAIHGGDQYGVVLQKGAVTRVTYVGPPAVFQFDVIDKTKGSEFVGGSIAVGRRVYFANKYGIYVTDGVTVESITSGKVEKYFTDQAASSNGVPSFSCGYDEPTGQIYFGFNNSNGTTINRGFVLNEQTLRWTSVDLSQHNFITPNSGQVFGHTLMGINTTGILGKYQATAGSATLVTGDIEMTSGGRSFVSGVKPNVESSGTAPAVTVRIGSRNDLATTPAYTATTTPTTRTGFADCRVNAKYHRAEVQIVGNFDKAIGVEFKAKAAGKA